MGTSCVLESDAPMTQLSIYRLSKWVCLILRQNFQAYLEVRPLLLDLLEPRLDRRERSGVGDAVDQQECVRRGDRESGVEEEQTKG